MNKLKIFKRAFEKMTRKQVQKDIKELQEEGVLEREGSNRNGKWIVIED